MKKIVKINNLKELEAFAEKLSQKIKAPFFIGLKGELGAGKTQLTKFLVKHLGGNIDDVASPTFTLMNEYLTNKGKVYHFDLYRLSSIDELEEIGYKDFFFDNNSITIVEWIDKIPECVPENYLIIEIKFGENENIRILEIDEKI